MNKRPSNNFQEGNASSHKNMKATTINQVPTQQKQYRDYQYTIYEHTNFEAHKSEYITICDKIRTQRLIEHLGRYKPKEEKQLQVNIFKKNFHRLKELLFLMTKQADKYKSLMANNTPLKEGKSTNVSFDYQVSFRKKIRKDLKDIETWWMQLFCEGSLKRLVPILNLLRIQQDQIDFGIDISQWHLEIQYKFSSSKNSSGCCCV